MGKDIQMGKDVVITDELREKFHLNEDLESEEPICKPVRWRYLFPASVIKQASGKTMQSKIRITRDWGLLKAEYYPDAKERKAAGISSKARLSYNSPYYSYYSNDLCFPVTIGKWPLDINTDLEPSLLTCGCPEGKKGELCCHEAAVLYHLEQQNGGLIVAKEGEYASRERIHGIKQRKKHEEQECLREKYGLEKCPALDFFKGRKDSGGIAVYDMRTALKEYVTDSYSIHMAKDILENHPSSVNMRAQEQKDRDGTRTYLANLSAEDSLFRYSFSAGSADITGNKLHIDTMDGYLDASYMYKSYEDEFSDEETEGEFEDYPENQARENNYLNINGLILCKLLWDETDQLAEETVDLTDEKAKKFFRNLEKANRVKIQKTEFPETQRKKAVELFPRIIMEAGEAKLSFRIQKAGGKVIVVRNVRELIAACVDKRVLTLSKTESIDFGEYEFTDHSAGLYDFLQRKVGDVSDLNSQIEAKNMRSRHSVRTINVTSNLDFKGAVLDNFYDVWEGQKAEYQDKTNGVASKEIPVAHRNIRLSLTCDRLSDAKGIFSGIAVHGLIPVLLHGSGSHRYTLNADGLSRITQERTGDY